MKPILPVTLPSGWVSFAPYLSEVPRCCRMAAALARALGVSTEHLIGEDEARFTAGKRGPAFRLQQQIARIQQLPRARQRFLVELIETTLQQAGNPPVAG